ncbi:MAG: hypothetical protein [Caudoviricetes sp.]|nr:MAG: hypothetical protein [Caudoviricetes sp.]
MASNAALDGALKSIIQGVSQQVPRERLDGQVSLQTNMLSDVVRGMRRRPGMRVRTPFAFGGEWSNTQVFASSVDVGDTAVHILVNTAMGALVVLSESFQVLHNVWYPYLVGVDASVIQVATLRGYLYICNTSKQPVKVVNLAGLLDPAKTGFFFIPAGQFSKKFNVTATVAGTSYTGTYTAPNGNTAGDSDKTTPDYIADQLAISLRAAAGAALTVTLTGSYAFVQSTAPTLSVTSDSGSSFIVVSNASRVTQVSELPKRLPASANGMLMSVGSNPKTAAWYRYDQIVTNSWLEAGAYGSASGMSNMPLRLSLDGAYTVETPAYEGRLAGTDDSNEDPPFFTKPITGFGVFQGRLVILSGADVCMSAAGRPLRWFRSTVTELLVADPIYIFSGAATSTNFTHCVQFNKDLLLFSRSCQAVVPSGNAVISPTTAQIVITSSYSSTGVVTPIVAGRSLLYFAPRSERFASVLELVPSNTTDSQYTTNDISAHIPRYIPGTVRQATASTTSNSLVLVGNGDSRSMFVQEYLWSADEKAQSAWHQWTSPADIACTWFVRDTVFAGLSIGGVLYIVSIEPQAGDTVDGLRRPFSDLYGSISVESRSFIVPTHLRPTVLAGGTLLMTYATGTTAGEWVGIDSVNTATWLATVVRNIPDGVYMLGLRYRSAISPTPPLLRDRNGVVIGTGTANLIRWELSMQDVGEFEALIQRNSEVLENGTYSGLTYSSEDLLPNTPLRAQVSRVVVPVRATAQDTTSTFSCDGEHDLGLLTCEFVMQFHQTRRRA